MRHEHPNIAVVIFLACAVFCGMTSIGIKLARDWALVKDAQSTGMDWAAHIEALLSDSTEMYDSDGRFNPNFEPRPREFESMVSEILALGNIFQIDFINPHCHCELSIRSNRLRAANHNPQHVTKAENAIGHASITKSHRNAHTHGMAHQDGGAHGMTHQDGGAHGMTHQDGGAHGMAHQDDGAHGMTHRNSHEARIQSADQKPHFPLNRDLVHSAIERHAHHIFIRKGSDPHQPSTFAEVYHPVTLQGEPAYALRVLVNLEAQAAQYTQLLIWGAIVLLALLVLVTGFPAWKYVQSVKSKREADNRAHYLAHHDVLTSVVNRNGFQELAPHILETCAASNWPVMLLLVDVDNFKEINDFYGHQIGDRVLTSLAAHLESTAPEGSVVARIGGDEFAVMIPANGPDLISTNDLITGSDSLELLIEDGGRQIVSSYCIGYARAPDHGSELNVLMQNADLALYAAKSSLDCRFQEYQPEMGAAFQTRVNVLAEFKDALENSLIVPNYQPLVDLRTGRVAGLEALARWYHPTRGILNPASFQDALDDRFLGDRIGRMMLQKILQDIRQWKADGVPFESVGLNVGESDLLRPDFVSDIADGLAQCGLAGNSLAIEVTETCVFGKNKGMFLDKLEQLRDMGCYVAVDDFGVGYSSINHIKELPCSAVKIDKSFVREVVQSGCDQAIIKALRQLGQAINYKLVVEGVETHQQMELLRSLGCELAQGYFFSTPVPASEVPGVIDTLNGNATRASRIEIRRAS